jgi:Cu+-exporting ATPase
MDMDVICRGKKCTIIRIKSAALHDDTATIGDVQEAIAAVKLKCKDIYYVNIGLVVDVAAGSISYVLATGGRAFTGAREAVAGLMRDGIDVYIASGDSRRPLDALARDFSIPASNVYDAVSPTGKKEIVDRLKTEYDLVFMVGDGVNDKLAFESADVALLTEQQKSLRPPELYAVVDVTINDIRKVEDVVRESLHMINR